MWRRRNLILAMMILSAMCVCALTSFVPPLYKTAAFFFPQNHQNDFFADVDALDKTIILSKAFHDLKLNETSEYNPEISDDSSVVAELFKKYRSFRIQDGANIEGLEWQELQGNVGITTDRALGMVEIYAISKDPKRAAELANYLASSVSATLKDFHFVKIGEITKETPSAVIETARIDYSPMSFDYGWLASLGAGIGFFLGILAAVIADRIQYRR